MWIVKEKKNQKKKNSNSNNLFNYKEYKAKGQT
jgi:hypothetical protein